jgi:hypothetical protein
MGTGDEHDDDGRPSEGRPYGSRGFGRSHFGARHESGAPPSLSKEQQEQGKSASDDIIDKAQKAIADKPLKVSLDLGGATQFGRASMRREADREVREARWVSQNDIGAA